MADKEILVVAGIRSQYIKVASLQRASPSRLPFQWRYLDLGQHYDDELAGQYIREYAVAFDRRLHCGRKEVASVQVLADMIVAAESEIAAFDPFCVVVMGDANCTLAAALAASTLGIPLVHLEAGVRTGRRTPEERNRVVVDSLSDLHLAASKPDRDHLVAEGRGGSTVFVGDVVRDLAALDCQSPRAMTPEYAVLTLHRHENTQDLAILLNACVQAQLAGLRVYFLGHPRVLDMLRKAEVDLGISVVVRPSVGHRELLQLMRSASVVITDSGALQRESYYVGTRSVVLQDEPFWPSLVRAGFNIAVSPGALTAAHIRKAMVPVDVKLEDFGTPPVAATVRRAVERWANEVSE
ncbi:UDP-N-acetylglucosamine 2-epimerase [Micromonospora chalcea]